MNSPNPVPASPDRESAVNAEGPVPEAAPSDPDITGPHQTPTKSPRRPAPPDHISTGTNDLRPNLPHTMKIRSLLRPALVVTTALMLATLVSCAKDEPKPSAPGPHQGNGVHEGKDTPVRSPGPRQ